MRKILAICLSLATHLHAGSTNNATYFSTSTASSLDSSISFLEATAPSSAFDMDEQLAKIADICLTLREHEQLTGDILRHGMARIFNVNLVNEAQAVIGLEELRAVLGFAPPGNWTNYKEPSREEIAAALTIEEYYELREPRSKMRSLNSTLFFEKNFPPAIAFLDMRMPAIRAIYRLKFEEIRRHHGPKGIADRKEIDRMLEDFRTTSLRIDRAFQQIFLRNSLCLLTKGMLHN
ncbi:hypothetical protein GCK72_017164 [Caenorhabditis remanei]|uniref:Uncharacterized protein n=1 Tax=Caenorhabditis remanei TaxID=31234 RepID=A0A6A5G758_CAERE|nr:hypothetical protein GCK72_017164 [Caenorhabditis remanei]KAF1750613.1 hypothetical protein GCK72_017164 [Caenorhabditis remanei]